MAVFRIFALARNIRADRQVFLQHLRIYHQKGSFFEYAHAQPTRDNKAMSPTELMDNNITPLS